MDSSEVNRILVSRLREVCEYLLPNGQVKGHLWVVGGLDGEKGGSLQVTLEGAAAGRFKDFANPDSDKGATPLWLWSKVKKIPFSKAIEEAKEWLGVTDTDYGIKKHKTSWMMPQPADRNGTQVAQSNSKVMDYLVIERRLDPLVVAKAKIGETKDGEWVVIPYFDQDQNQKEAFHIKRLKVDRKDGKKEMFASKGTRRSLYGWHLIGDDVSEITITEGEFDALSYHSVGIPALSVPNGVSDFSWIETDWELLERFERINIHFDMDEPGKAAAITACHRLGLHRCFIVSSKFKDANEHLVANGKREEFLAQIEQAKAIELDEIKRPDEYTDEVIDYYSIDWSKRGWETPWFPALPWRIRKGEFTVLSGFSGHGKTIALNHLMLHLVQQGAKVMDASLEIKPGMTLYNMTRCALGKKMSSNQEVRACIDWVSDSMFFLDCIGTVSVGRLMQAMEYARKRHGIDVFVIDSLFKCGMSSEDYGGQREFMDKITTFCNNTGAHVILVAHSRKVSSGNEYAVPTKADISGSSDISNAAFNVVIWFRNKMKKQKLDEARQAIPPNDQEIAKWIDAPDGTAFLDKQRFGEGEEARVFVWLNTDALQFHTSRNVKIPYFKME